MQSIKWEEEFDKNFPDRIARVIDDFGDTTKDDFKYFIRQTLESQKQEMKEKVREEIQKLQWWALPYEENGKAVELVRIDEITKILNGLDNL